MIRRTGFGAPDRLRVVVPHPFAGKREWMGHRTLVEELTVGGLVAGFQFGEVGV